MGTEEATTLTDMQPLPHIMVHSLVQHHLVLQAFAMYTNKQRHLAKVSKQTKEKRTMLSLSQ